ncbi:hypothetical protein KRR38_20865 [Novosphingobium sp. G106]|uniref:hypothetical protein n=1 Tax=Novosphingobium sp. G106 TaxID=2849500 RepID=UPI001C2DC0FF|nr:hypothetical protein [Novosphingobium sp. G106]MBV1690066.1 hypothetical protein [Novosphingobium sp. G106]
MPDMQFPDLDPSASRVLITNALRDWHDARQTGAPVMPYLFASLHGPACALLAPVLDSLFRFYQAALNRTPVTGQTECLSDDEALLLALISRAEFKHETFDCPIGIARGFDCALCSARIMLAFALEDQSCGRRLQ